LSIAIFADEAKAAVAGAEMALAGAEVADDTLWVGLVFVPPAAEERTVGQAGVGGR
jgi:hypothetical protein